jgi:hypothetical protein
VKTKFRAFRNALSVTLPGLGNAVALGVYEQVVDDPKNDGLTNVERDTSEVPTAWCVFKVVAPSSGHKGQQAKLTNGETVAAPIRTRRFRCWFPSLDQGHRRLSLNDTTASE